MAGYVEKGVIRLHEKVGHDIWRIVAAAYFYRRH